MSGQAIDPDWASLNGTERDILVSIALAGPANAAELHSRHREGEPEKSATTRRMIYQLEEKGLIRREPGVRSEKINHLTLAGVAVIRKGVLEPASRINDRGDTLADVQR
jgi:DNA-binding MarR family transcriptional regulator